MADILKFPNTMQNDIRLACRKAHKEAEEAKDAYRPVTFESIVKDVNKQFETQGDDTPDIA